MAHDEFEDEPVPGLPARLPEGESLLWQGSPAVGPVLRHLFRVHWLALYMVVIAAWKLQQALSRGAPLAQAALEAGTLLALGAVAVAVMVAIGVRVARTTVYTITSRRVAMRFGIALPMTITIPFTKIAGAGLVRRGDGSGDIALVLAAGSRVSYLIAWPHVAPWRFLSPRPSFRGLADPLPAAEILARAVEQAAPGEIARGAIVDGARPGGAAPGAPAPAAG